MATIITPNMLLTVPIVGQEAGPQYATDVNACLTIVDQHNHSSGSGVQINPAGLNINADLTFQGNSATNIKSILFSPQASFTTPLSLYVTPGTESPSAINDLWFNDGNGTAVQVTSNGAVFAPAAAIPGESYTLGTFAWKQGSGSTTPANFDIGSVTLRPNIAATTFGTALQVNPSISSSFTLTLPNNPSSLPGASFLRLDTAGNITGGPTISGGLTTTNLSSSAGILGTQLAANTISGNNIVNNTITSTQIAASTITTTQIANNTIELSNIDPLAINYGTFTPTASNFGNVTSAAPQVFQMMRIGQTVTLSGIVNLQATSAGSFSLFLTIPFTTNNFIANTQAAGTTISASSFARGALYANIGASTVTLIGTTSSNGLESYCVHLTYLLV